MKKGLLFTLVAALLLPMCLSLTAHAAVYLGTGDNVILVVTWIGTMILHIIVRLFGE